jgi:hypothetical protein
MWTGLEQAGEMALIAKRKIHQTWREAVVARAADDEARTHCLAVFDGIVGQGRSEAEAAFRALAARNLLWDVVGPTDPGPPTPPERAAEARDPHRIPNV